MVALDSSMLRFTPLGDRKMKRKYKTVDDRNENHAANNSTIQNACVRRIYIITRTYHAYTLSHSDQLFARFGRVVVQ